VDQQRDGSVGKKYLSSHKISNVMIR
jgi:hypothetical protein